MNANSFGRFFTVTTFGESRSRAVGAVIDGCPAGISLSEKDIQPALDRRKPAGRSGRPCTGETGGLFDSAQESKAFSTRRAENDCCEILSGVYNGKTLGSPIAVLVKNNETSDKNYERLKHVYRPGHADYAYDLRYGFRDPRGGGRASGRETVGRVIGGAVAKKVLERFTKQNGLKKIQIDIRAAEIAGIKPAKPVPEQGPLPQEIFKKLQTLAEAGDSAGCVLACKVLNVPQGLGSPVFCKLDAVLAQGILSIGAVKGIEFGGGFTCAALTGSVNNDVTADWAGGISGGISASNRPPEIGTIKTDADRLARRTAQSAFPSSRAEGCTVRFNVAVKPPPSIKVEQPAFTDKGKKTLLSVSGNHDICLFPRIIPVTEAMVYITLADALLARCAGSLKP